MDFLTFFNDNTMTPKQKLLTLVTVETEPDTQIIDDDDNYVISDVLLTRYLQQSLELHQDIKGLKVLLPKEILIMNKNLDAISALIILEDYCNDKFTLSKDIDIKTWLK